MAQTSNPDPHPEQNHQADDAPDDLAILKQVSANDLEAFGHLVDRYTDRLHRYLLTSVRDHNTAEDLTQEVFVRVYRSAQRGTFDEQSPDMASWIFKIASNCLADHYRDRARHRAQPASDLAVPSTDGAKTALDFQAVAGRDPVEIAIRSEEDEAVRRLLDRLPASQQEVVRLKVYGGLKFREIAAVLDCPLATVKSRMRYALSRVEQIIAREKR